MTTSDSHLPADCNDTVWYLAYGSNMDPKVLTGRRQVKPIESIPVKVPDYWLSFDIAGLPFVEPCFGSILKKDKSRLREREYAYHVYTRTRYGTEFKWDPNNPEASYPPDLQGVAHRITQADWQRVIQTEGGWGHDVPTGYDKIEVECYPFNIKSEESSKIDLSQPIMAKVLIARPLSIRSHCQPSARYMGLLTSGAKIHHLEPDYQEYLASLVPYECAGTRAKLGRFLFMFINAPFLIGFMLVMLRQRHMNKKPLEQRKPPPYWVAWYMDKASRWSAAMHDYIVRPFFGSGRCSSIEHQKIVRLRIQQNQVDRHESKTLSSKRVRDEISNNEPRVVQDTEAAVEELGA
ncbi:hypothetical protein BGW41_000560 [Actinomortierella wolfii]|nr:hypothetical protein BGW41_000560 [Actinomortierella wolfii]